MPVVLELNETCRHLLTELRQEPDAHRLIEIETTTRLLAPHLIRAVADAVHAGHEDHVSDAGPTLAQMYEHLTWVRSHRDASLPEIRRRLIDAVTCACDVLDMLERI